MPAFLGSSRAEGAANKLLLTAPQRIANKLLLATPYELPISSCWQPIGVTTKHFVSRLYFLAKLLSYGQIWIQLKINQSPLPPSQSQPSWYGTHVSQNVTILYFRWQITSKRFSSASKCFLWPNHWLHKKPHSKQTTTTDFLTTAQWPICFLVFS